MRSIREQLERNVFSSWTLYGIRLAVAFFFVPYITSVLGDQRYGVWIIALQSITYLSLFDFGFERALVRLISRSLGLNDMPTVNRLINTASLFYAGIGCLVLVAAWAVANYILPLFEIGSQGLLQEGQQATLWLGLYLALRFWLFPFANSLGAFQRYDVSNLFQIAEEVVRTGLMALALANGYGLATLAAIILIVSTLRSLFSIGWLKGAFQELIWKPRLADRESAGELWQYGRTAFGITCLWMVVFNSDAILLGTLASVSAAGIFSPAAQVINQARNLINAVATPLTASIAQLEARKDQAAVRSAYMRGFSYVTYLTVVLMVGIIAFAEPFVRLWLPAEFFEAAPVMAILALGSAVFIPQIIGNSVLFGLGRHKYLLRVLAGEVILKLILSFLLIGKLGPKGMALATIAPQILLYATVFPYYIARELQISVWEIIRAFIRMTFVALLAAGVPAAIIRLVVPLGGWPAVMGGIIVVGIISLAIGWFILLPADRARLRYWISRK